MIRKELIGSFWVKEPVDLTLIVLSRFGIVTKYKALDIFIHDALQDTTCDRGLDAVAPSLRFQELRAEDLPNLSLADGLMSCQEIYQRFANGSRLFVALSGHTIVAHGWINPRKASLGHIKRPEVVLPEGIGYLHGVVTAPAYRRLGIGTRLLHHRLMALRQEGYRAVVSAVYPANRLAARWHIANGFWWWGRVRYLLWRGKDYWWNDMTARGRRAASIVQHSPFTFAESESS